MRINSSNALFLVFVVLLVVAQTSQSVNAQKDDAPTGIFESRQQYSEFMGGLKSLRDPEINAMLPALNDIMLARPIGQTARMYSIGGNPAMTLLTNEKIREDLEIVDSQLEEIEQVNRELQKRMAREVRELDFENPKELVERLRGLTDNAKTEIEGVFLPHQIDRLKQLGLRQEMNRKGVLGALLSDPLASELEITAEQKKKLQESAKEIAEELARDLEAVRAKARNKLIKNLSGQQQQKLESLVGDEYDFAGKSSNGIMSGTAKFKSPKKVKPSKLKPKPKKLD